MSQSLQKFLAAGAGDGQAVLPHQNPVFLHRPHVFQVDQAAGTAPGKVSPLQQFLVTGKGAPLADDLGAGVEKDIVGLHLDIEDAARRDAPQKAFPGLDVQHRAVRPG